MNFADNTIIVNLYFDVNGEYLGLSELDKIYMTEYNDRRHTEIELGDWE